MRPAASDTPAKEDKMKIITIIPADGWMRVSADENATHKCRTERVACWALVEDAGCQYVTDFVPGESTLLPRIVPELLGYMHEKGKLDEWKKIAETRIAEMKTEKYRSQRDQWGKKEN